MSDLIIQLYFLHFIYEEAKPGLVVRAFGTKTFAIYYQEHGDVYEFIHGDMAEALWYLGFFFLIIDSWLSSSHFYLLLFFKWNTRTSVSNRFKICAKFCFFMHFMPRVYITFMKFSIDLRFKFFYANENNKRIQKSYCYMGLLENTAAFVNAF